MHENNSSCTSHSECGCGHEHGNNDHIRLKIIRIILSIALFITGFFTQDLISILCFIVAYIIAGYDVVIAALSNIFRGRVFDENFLMTIATFGAFAIGEFPEGVAVMLFYQVGELFQDIAVSRSKKSISSLMDIRPDYANLYVDGKSEIVSPSTVKIGDIIMVKAGEKIPLDGVVSDGSASLDTSALTGESVPRTVHTGDNVLSGTLNTNGVLYIKVEKEYAQSTASKILDLVQNAAEKKSQSEKFISKFARYYTPIVVVFALLLAILPPLFTGGDFSTWIYRALIFLVVSCPCALVVSVPLGFFAGIGCASKHGILAKGSNYLEMLTHIDTVVLDKTGTITEGVFEVTHITGYDSLLETAAYAEHFSNHPIAKSIQNAYNNTVDTNSICNYTEISGMGISVQVDNKSVLAGNDKLMRKFNIDYKSHEQTGTVVHVASDGKYIGYIVISDKIKKDSKDAINTLKNMGIGVCMLTGDNRQTALDVAKSVGIDNVYSNLLPQDKLSLVEKQIDSGKHVAFVGDGINDAPVLMRADIGIAMGGVGSDAAIEAADVVIMNDELSKLPVSIKIAKSTMRIVWQNIIFAIGIKVIIMLLSTIGYSTMWLAIFADVGVSVLAILNSVRALYYK